MGEDVEMVVEEPGDEMEYEDEDRHPVDDKGDVDADNTSPELEGPAFLQVDTGDQTWDGERRMKVADGKASKRFYYLYLFYYFLS